jgi:C1A family cysteine protease
MFSKIVTIATLGLATASRFYDSDPEHLRAMWEDFKTTHNRSYGKAEDEHRFAIFVNNLKTADLRNQQEIANGGEECHGITQFSDITQEEFEATYLGSHPNPAAVSAGEHTPIDTENVSAYPTSKDWTGVYTTPVKDQGSCGSCWAFSATEQVESDAIRVKGWCSGNPSNSACWLSPQQVNSCDTGSSGCNGGWSESAFSYIINTGNGKAGVVQTNGLETNSAYPYTSGTTGVTGTCGAKAGTGVVGISAYTTITTGETSMTNWVGNTGPLSVCLCAANWNLYTGGIMTSCCNLIDHCVQAVGYDTGAGYWKVRNQWGTRWGESGFIRLQYGTNMCRIAYDPNYVTVK